MYKVTVYVPESHLDQVKAAMFGAGAGRVGNYDSCAWQVRGQGQFRPLKGANPFLGHVGTLEQVEEWKVELVCPDECVREVISALRVAHPYEEPAYDVVKTEDF